MKNPLGASSLAFALLAVACGASPSPTPNPLPPAGPASLALPPSPPLDPRLRTAAQRGQAEEVRRLLASGVSVHGRDSDGVTALGHCLAQVTDAGQTPNALLDAGASPRDLDSGGDHLLMHPSWGWIFTGFVARHPELVNVANIRGQTPIMAAAYFGYAPPLSLLLKHKADVTARDLRGRTPLMYAVGGNRMLAVRMLLKAGAPPNDRDLLGNTALHHALLDEVDLETIQSLLRAGVDANVANTAGHTPMDLAREHGRFDAIELLRQHGGRPGAGVSSDPRINEFGGATQLTTAVDQRLFPGAERQVLEYGSSEIAHFWGGEREPWKLIRRRTTVWPPQAAASDGTATQVDVFGPSEARNSGRDGRDYGAPQAISKYFAPQKVAVTGVEWQTEYWDELQLGIGVIEVHSLAAQARDGVVSTTRWFALNNKAWAGDPRRSDRELAQGSVRRNLTNGLTTETVTFTPESFYGSWGSLQRREIVRDPAGVIRGVDLIYRHGPNLPCPNFAWHARVTDSADDKGIVRQEKVEYNDTDRFARSMTVTDYGVDGWITQRVTTYRPRVAGKPQQQDTLTETFALDAASGKVTVHAVATLNGKSVRDETAPYRSELYPADDSYKALMRPDYIALRADTAPAAAMLDPDALVAYLMKDMRSTTERFAAIFRWMRSFMRYNHDYASGRNMDGGVNRMPFAIYQRCGVCADQTNIFHQLAARAVDPLAAGGIGGGNHAWNIVYFDGDYWQIDATTGKLFFKDPTGGPAWMQHFNDWQWYPAGGRQQ